MNEPTRTEKKPWKKPELIVLVRSKPEEAVVLQLCKQGYIAYGPTVSIENCETTASCVACSVMSPS